MFKNNVSLLQRRKGITPVIATVLLLLMTVAAAGMAYQFVVVSQSEIQESSSGEIQRQQVESEARFQIDSVYSSTGNALNVVIRNTGSHTYNAGEITFFLDGVLAAPSPVLGTIAPKVLATATFTNKFPTAVGDTINIKVVPAVGTPVTYTCTNNGKNFC